MADGPGATFITFDAVPWAVEDPSAVPAALLEAAAETGAKRKRLVKGEAGFFMNYSVLPPNFTGPTHTHSHDELLVIVKGGCTILDGGPTLGVNDTMAIAANHAYGFTCGPDGMTMLTIRAGEASTALDAG
jgi:quercetin dioxygenase-like cupin family protein